MGPDWLRSIDMTIPNVLMANVPGFEKMASGMMKKTMRDKGVATIEELRSICLEADVKLVACQMTVDLFSMDQAEFIPEIEDWIGAAEGPVERSRRLERSAIAFGCEGSRWDDERVLDRYELLYQLGLVSESPRDGATLGIAGREPNSHGVVGWNAHQAEFIWLPISCPDRLPSPVHLFRIHFVCRD